MITTKDPRIDDVLASWPKLCQQVAHTVIGKYGPPAEVGKTMLVWHDAGPWKRTVVHGSETEHNWPNEHHDVVEQFIDYPIDPARAADLASFDGSVTVLRTRGEMSAMCEGEEANYLAINLAHEILASGLSVEDARTKYEAKAKLMAAKVPDPYLQELLFEVPSGETGDPDELPPDASKEPTTSG